MEGPRVVALCLRLPRHQENTLVAIELTQRRWELALNEVNRAGSGVFVPGRRVYNTAFSFLGKEMRYLAWPCGFHPRLPPLYDGTTEHVGFLQLYAMVILAAGGDHRVMVHWLPVALEGAALAWVSKSTLPAAYVPSWGNLCGCFFARFVVGPGHPASKDDLADVVQRPGKTLHGFARRFHLIRMRNPKVISKETVSAFSPGATHPGVKRALASHRCVSSIKIFRIIDELATTKKVISPLTRQGTPAWDGGVVARGSPALRAMLEALGGIRAGPLQLDPLAPHRR
jgi:hypothetical protein